MASLDPALDAVVMVDVHVLETVQAHHVLVLFKLIHTNAALGAIFNS
jgi:hypothetical protein